MERVNVELGERSYTIFIDSGILDELGERLIRFEFSPRIAIISNPAVFSIYGNIAVNSLRNSGFDVKVVTIPDGEEYKDFLWAHYIYGELLGHRLDRKSALIAIGGGVIGDITGFVASTYMRGISFVQVPTTLLAQVDSSVGGKTGINHPLGKNMIGTFFQPRIVWADTDTLKTLPRKEFLSGLAEIIKYGVIWDEELFSFLEHNREKVMELDRDALKYLIRRSCEIKAEVVSKDETESGLRAILNYGHTIGHAIETATGYTKYLHGEAIAMGMHAEARLSSLLGVMESRDVRRIASLISSYGLPIETPQDIGTDRMFSLMQIDKKAVAGKMKFILPDKIGSVRITDVEDRMKITEALKAR